MVETEEGAGGELLTCRRQRGASGWLPDCTPHPHLGRKTEEERRSTVGFPQELTDPHPHLGASPTQVWGVPSRSPTSNLQQLFKLLLEAVSQQIHKLAAGKVHPAEERELRITEQIEGMSTSLKHRWFCVLHHHLLELLQEQLQVLREKTVGEDRAVGGAGRTTPPGGSRGGEERNRVESFKLQA